MYEREYYETALKYKKEAEKHLKKLEERTDLSEGEKSARIQMVKESIESFERSIKYYSKHLTGTFPSTDTVDAVKKLFVTGLRVRLTKMDDRIPLGTEGTVQFVDDAAQIHVLWDNYGQLAVAYPEDACEIIYTGKLKSISLKPQGSYKLPPLRHQP